MLMFVVDFFVNFNFFSSIKTAADFFFEELRCESFVDKINKRNLIFEGFLLLLFVFTKSFFIKIDYSLVDKKKR